MVLIRILGASAFWDCSGPLVQVFTVSEPDCRFADL